MSLGPLLSFSVNDAPDKQNCKLDFLGGFLSYHIQSCYRLRVLLVRCDVFVGANSNATEPHIPVLLLVMSLSVILKQN